MAGTCHITNNNHNQMTHAFENRRKLDSGVKILQVLYFSPRYIHDTVT